MITDRQRQAIVGALLEAAQAVNGGGHPGDAIRAMLGKVRGVSEEPASAPVGSPGLSLVHTPRHDPIPVAELPARAEEAALVQRVFAHWVRASGKAGAKLTGDRRQKILARRREGYSEQDMIRAIDGICASPYHRGENDQGTQYMDLTLALRNGTQLERFRDMAPARTAPVVTDDPKADALMAKIDRLRKDRDRALKEGRTDDYQQLLQSIRRAEEELGRARRVEG